MGRCTGRTARSWHIVGLGGEGDVQGARRHSKPRPPPPDLAWRVAVELAGIVAGVLLAAGGLVVLAGWGLHAWVAGHQDLAERAARTAGESPGRLAGRDRGRREPRLGTGGNALALTLIVGLIAIALAAVAFGTLVDNVTDGDGIAVVDHQVARFVAGHRTPELTTVMKAASTAAGPAGMAVCALAAGLLIGIVWRSWVPGAVLGSTVAGAIGLTIVFKAALAQPRPPLAQAVAAAGGHGFPSGHAAAAAAVCGAIAWLCSIRLRSWRARTGICAVAAMLAALVGISRVYLGVHWATDVIGGWIFAVMWLAVVVSTWAAFARLPHPPRTRVGRPAGRRHWPLPARRLKRLPGATSGHEPKITKEASDLSTSLTRSCPRPSRSPGSRAEDHVRAVASRCLLTGVLNPCVPWVSVSWSA
jgi:membrane-associated phospholipid phosphatase